MDLTAEEKSWWKSIDLNDDYLCKIWSRMFGTTEQRIKQLYTIRNNANFAEKR